MQARGNIHKARCPLLSNCTSLPTCLKDFFAEALFATFLSCHSSSSVVFFFFTLLSLWTVQMDATFFL